jgi:protein SCO1
MISERAAAWFAVLVALLFASSALAAPVPTADQKTRTSRTPPQLRGVGVTEHLKAKIPLDLPFVDENGKPVHLKDYFDGKHPVIITMNYSACPMLCPLELSALARTMHELSWAVGNQYRVVTVSMDPTETPATAKKSQARYTAIYDRPGATNGWHFLTGKDPDIHALADALGFGYHFDPKKKMYYHPAVSMVITPDGRVGRYLYGIHFSRETLRLGLVDASHGKIGTTIDKIVLLCCAYDPKEGSYSAVASRIMTLSAVLIAVVLGGFLSLYWLAEFRKKRKVRAAGGTAGSSPEAEGSTS